MSPELRSLTAFAIAAIVTFAATPLVIKVAIRTAFLDLPSGYKEHGAPTPYLGGTAIMAGVVAAVLLVRGGVSEHGLMIACGLAICLVGTLDDRVNLSIWVRLLAEAAIAVALWSTGRGWDVFGSPPADLLLTVVWVVGLVNAFNIMDNMDGAAASMAGVSAVGAGVLALVSGDTALAPLCFAAAGACAAFLPRNLATPSRIFMGDGGSLLLGLLIARVTMAAVQPHYLGPSGVIVAALLVALVIFDTTLVVVSRRRAGRPVLSGGRDHTTHRLARRMGAPRNVALALAGTQLLVCAVTIALAQAGIGWVLLAGGAGLVLGIALIWQFERSPWLGEGGGAPALLPDAPVAVLEVVSPDLGAGALVVRERSS